MSSSDSASCPYVPFCDVRFLFKCLYCTVSTTTFPPNFVKIG